MPVLLIPRTVQAKNQEATPGEAPTREEHPARTTSPLRDNNAPDGSAVTRSQPPGRYTDEGTGGTSQ